MRRDKERKMKEKLKYSLYAIGSSISLFFLFGIPTAVIPNSWFIRMIPVNALDWVYLILSSLLMGTYVGVHFYKKKTTTTCDSVTAFGGLGSFLAFGCPICNKLLMVLFGSTFLLTYLEPYRPILGLFSIGLLSGALYWRLKK